MRWFGTALLLALAVHFVPALAAEKPTKITGIFSNLRYNAEGGDLLGTELFIVVSGEDYEAVVQDAEGAPGPVVIVPVKVDGSRVKFTVPGPSLGAGEYEGTIGPRGFEGTYIPPGSESTPQHISLPRKKSYWE